MVTVGEAQPTTENGLSVTRAEMEHVLHGVCPVLDMKTLPPSAPSISAEVVTGVR
jgi:hypothetical protein